MGFWSGNSNIGDIIGYMVIGEITITLNIFPEPKWTYCFFGATIFLIFMAILTLLLLHPYPNKLGITIEES